MGRSIEPKGKREFPMVKHWVKVSEPEGEPMFPMMEHWVKVPELEGEDTLGVVCRAVRLSNQTNSERNRKKTSIKTKRKLEEVTYAQSLTSLNLVTKGQK